MNEILEEGILASVLSNLSYDEILDCNLISKKFYYMLLNNSLWFNIIKVKYSNLICISEVVNYKKVYKELELYINCMQIYNYDFSNYIDFNDRANKEKDLNEFYSKHEFIIKYMIKLNNFNFLKEYKYLFINLFTKSKIFDDKIILINYMNKAQLNGESIINTLLDEYTNDNFNTIDKRCNNLYEYFKINNFDMNLIKKVLLKSQRDIKSTGSISVYAIWWYIKFNSSGTFDHFILYWIPHSDDCIDLSIIMTNSLSENIEHHVIIKFFKSFITQILSGKCELNIRYIIKKYKHIITKEIIEKLIYDSVKIFEGAKRDGYELEDEEDAFYRIINWLKDYIEN